jgi:hypothetical protein
MFWQKMHQTIRPPTVLRQSERCHFLTLPSGWYIVLHAPSPPTTLPLPGLDYLSRQKRAPAPSPPPPRRQEICSVCAGGCRRGGGSQIPPSLLVLIWSAVFCSFATITSSLKVFCRTWQKKVVQKFARKERWPIFGEGR